MKKLLTISFLVLSTAVFACDEHKKQTVTTDSYGNTVSKTRNDGNGNYVTTDKYGNTISKTHVNSSGTAVTTDKYGNTISKTR